MSEELGIFSGWKQIADYLGKGVRTVQRCERELGLPIHRLAGKLAGAVIATKAELDRWVTSGSIGVKAWPTERTNTIGAEFLRIASEVALTFCGVALAATDKGKRSYATQTARKAYDTNRATEEGHQAN
jgi:hypothetical protein